MVLLAVDTSGKDGSLALARIGEIASAQPSSSELEILNRVPLEGGTFSAQLVPQISALLARHKLNKYDIAAFAVASGPGSFTGLRVGLAAIKALAEILDKPIAAVSRLEAVARLVQSRGRIFAVLDAGRGEIYVGEYELGETVRLVDERLTSRSDLLEQTRHATIVTPDHDLADAARHQGLNVEEVVRPTSEHIAQIGWEMIQQGKIVSPENLEANYIRRSDAEIFAKKS